MITLPGVTRSSKGRWLPATLMAAARRTRENVVAGRQVRAAATIVTQARIPDGRTLTVLIESAEPVKPLLRCGERTLEPFRTIDLTGRAPSEQLVQASFHLPADAESCRLVGSSDEALPAAAPPRNHSEAVRDADCDANAHYWQQLPGLAEWTLCRRPPDPRVEAVVVGIDPARLCLRLLAGELPPSRLWLTGRGHPGILEVDLQAAADGALVASVPCDALINQLVAEGVSGTALWDLAVDGDARPRAIRWRTRDITRPRSVLRLAGAYSATPAMSAWLRPYWTDGGELRLKVELNAAPNGA